MPVHNSLPIPCPICGNSLLVDSTQMKSLGNPSPFNHYHFHCVGCDKAGTYYNLLRDAGEVCHSLYAGVLPQELVLFGPVRPDRIVREWRFHTGHKLLDVIKRYRVLVQVGEAGFWMRWDGSSWVNTIPVYAEKDESDVSL